MKNMDVIKWQHYFLSIEGMKYYILKIFLMIYLQAKDNIVYLV
ncbi:Uncharacterised protein [Yersinia frederiksenii]|uniref:Uncharacterized protein n=1 Tax=Yersinia frederiksenii TaxID=29484 RepID=A0AAI9ENS7_YERFR|nr:Uncharacterised protein [Yersinia frederiksenii]